MRWLCACGDTGEGEFPEAHHSHALPVKNYLARDRYIKCGDDAYTCPTCWALVHPYALHHHDRWHATGEAAEHA